MGRISDGDLQELPAEKTGNTPNHPASESDVGQDTDVISAVRNDYDGRISGKLVDAPEGTILKPEEIDQLEKEKRKRQTAIEDDEFRKIKYPSHIQFPFILSLKKHICWLFAFIAAGLLLLIISQAVQYYAIVAALPVYSQCIFIPCFGVCGAVILWIVFKIGRFLYRFNVKPDIDIRAIKILNDRVDLQSAARKATEDAIEKLKFYLSEYHFEDEEREKEERQFFVQVMGMEQDNYESLKKAKIAFLEDKKHTSSQRIQNFQDKFQGQIDELAKKRVSGYYYKVLTGTALSPRAMVDQLIIASACVSMICDLLQIYRVKPATGQSLLLLAHTFFNIYIGGRMQGDVEKIVDSTSNFTSGIFSENTADLTKIFGHNIVNGLPFIGNVAKPIVAKLAEGTINAILLQKLGTAVINQLKPTSERIT